MRPRGKWDRCRLLSALNYRSTPGRLPARGKRRPPGADRRPAAAPGAEPAPDCRRRNLRRRRSAAGKFRIAPATAIRRQTILRRGGKGMFRRQAVIHRDGARPAGDRQPGDQPAVGYRGNQREMLRRENRAAIRSARRARRNQSTPPGRSPRKFFRIEIPAANGDIRAGGIRSPAHLGNGNSAPPRKFIRRMKNRTNGFESWTWRHRECAAAGGLSPRATFTRRNPPP